MKSRLPILNVIAGVAIGYANNTWVTVLGAAALWLLIFCLFVWVLDSKRAAMTIEKMRVESQKPFFSNHPVVGFYSIEAVSSLLTVLPVAAIVYAIR
jgi:hypothetical protein